MWGPLLEKVWAKYNQNYERTEGGLAGEGFEFLSNAPTNTLTIKTFTNETLWNLVNLSDKDDQIMSVWTNTSGGTHDVSGTYNLPLCHAYTLTGTYLVKTEDGVSHRLFLIKNPWRSDTSFTGKWRDNSTLWTPKVISQVTGYQNKNDGYIWLEDFEMFVAFVGLQITDLKRG